MVKLVLASKVTCHVTFISMSEPHAGELAACIGGFVEGSSATSRPSRAAFALSWEQRSMRLVHKLVASVQTEVISRLLEPNSLV